MLREGKNVVTERKKKRKGMHKREDMGRREVKERRKYRKKRSYVKGGKEVMLERRRERRTYGKEEREKR